MSDYTVADTIHFMFTTRKFSTGAPFTLAGTPVISAYENESLTQITAGITLGVDHDGVTGLNLVTVVASGANGFESGKDYHLVITTGTVDSVSVVGEVIGRFTLSRSAAAVDLANGTDGLGAIKAETASILADTAEIGAAGAGLTALATQASVNTIDDLLDTEIAALTTEVAKIPKSDGTASWNATALAAIQSEANAALVAYDPPTRAEATSDANAILAAVDTVDNFLDTEIAAIKAKTDSLTFTDAGKVDANVLSIGTDAAALTAFKRAVLGNVIATVGAASTTTSIVTSSMTPAASVADQFKGRIVTFDKDTTTAALRGQSTDITANTDVGVLTVTALTTAPASGDTFTIT